MADISPAAIDTAALLDDWADDCGARRVIARLCDALDAERAKVAALRAALRAQIADEIRAYILKHPEVRHWHDGMEYAALLINPRGAEGTE